MSAIRLYTTAWCGLCLQAKALLDARGLGYEEIPLDDDPAFRQTRLRARRPLGPCRSWSIDDEPVGGYRELAARWTRPPALLEALAERLAAP